MAKHHSPVERFQCYLKGWSVGAGRKAIPKNLAEDEDFQRGLRDGQKARSKALEERRLAVGAEKPTGLR